MDDLQQATDYPNINIPAQVSMFLAWEHHKMENIMTFRDQVHTSTVTNVTAAPPKVPWTKQFDTTKEQFLLNH